MAGTKACHPIAPGEKSLTGEGDIPLKSRVPWMRLGDSLMLTSIWAGLKNFLPILIPLLSSTVENSLIS
jgi:hypothetical protein